MVDNAKPEAIPNSWIENPQVEEKSLWYKGEDGTYPKCFVEVNGVLMTYEGVKELRGKLDDVID